jgi:hypothetical protein
MGNDEIGGLAHALNDAVTDRIEALVKIQTVGLDVHFFSDLHRSASAHHGVYKHAGLQLLEQGLKNVA